jgi:hypothetical protein
MLAVACPSGFRRANLPFAPPNRRRCDGAYWAKFAIAARILDKPYVPSLQGGSALLAATHRQFEPRLAAIWGDSLFVRGGRDTQHG